MVGVHPNRSDAMKLFHEIDRDGDGIILWQDLEQMFSSPTKRKTNNTSSPLSNYQRRVRASSPDFSREVKEDEKRVQEKETLSSPKKRLIMETRHRSSSANWLQSLRSPSSSPTQSFKKSPRPKSPLRTREKRETSPETLNTLNIPKNAIRREGLYWIATYQTPDREDHYVGTFRTYDLAVKRYLERASYYRKSEEEEEEEVESVERLKDDDDDKMSFSTNNEDAKLLSPSVPASHDDERRRSEEKIEPTTYDQETKLFIRTGVVRDEVDDQSIRSRSDSHRSMFQEPPTKRVPSETISAIDELVEVVRYLRQRLRRADRDIKDYEMYVVFERWCSSFRHNRVSYCI